MNQIADFIIRFRQGNKKNLELKQTNVISSLLDTLEKTGYINYSLLDTKKQGMMRIEVSNNRVQGMELISKNSRDVFLSYSDLLCDSKLKSRSCFYILATSKLGIISSWEALENKIGGKILVRV